MRAKQVRYGSDSSQFVEVWESPGRAACTVVLLHGGFWRATYDRSLMDGLCEDIARRGWQAVNVEYRREQGWPAMAADVEAGWYVARQLTGDAALVIAGHSAGGHLALWLAATSESKPGLVVSLAGCADLALADSLGLGDGAARALVGDLPIEAADPAAHVPSGVRTVLVAPIDDDVVPREVSASYAEKARAAGDDVRLIEPPGDHFSVIDPASEGWGAAVESIEQVLSGATTTEPVRESGR